MGKKYSTYCALFALATVMTVAIGIASSSFADEPDDAEAPTYVTRPSLIGQSSGFALETPAEAGAKPIASNFIIPSPKPVAPFPIRLNRFVRRYLSDLMTSPGHLQDTFDRSHPYLGEMIKVLRSYGLPDNLVYLAFAESEFSHSGRGPWQFNSDTAQRFGLHIDSYVDERRDPVLSTKAAAEYLATLHDAAGEDWPMTVVAWNNGDRAIDRYWSLRGPNFEKFGNRLPRRTRSLLGRFMAVAYIAQHADAYGITTVKMDEAPMYQTLRVRGGTPLSRVALDHGTTLTRLHDLNPALLRDVVPPNQSAYTIRVPLDAHASADRRIRF